MNQNIEEKYQEVVASLPNRKNISLSVIQREYGVGFPTAGRILEKLQEEGYVAKERINDDPRYEIISLKKKVEKDVSLRFMAFRDNLIDLEKDANIAINEALWKKDVLRRVAKSIEEYKGEKVRVIEDAEEDVLETIIETMDSRYREFAEKEVSGIDEYIEKAGDMDYIVVNVRAGCLTNKSALARLLAKGKPCGIRVVYSFGTVIELTDVLEKFTDKIIDLPIFKQAH
ncbi:MAG: hypothetical protein MJ239_03995 [Bacilli bacterium]|nr:hypothetical protein [Bacilli bacterium]